MGSGNRWVILPTGKSVDQGWLGEEKDRLYQALLQKAYSEPGNALCCCTQPPKHPISIRKLGERYHLARFPETGHLHTGACHFYAARPETCGRRAYALDAIQETKDGYILRMAVGLGKIKTPGPPHHEELALERETKAKGRSRPTTTALGVLHFLWETAGLNRREGGGKMSWFSATTRVHWTADTVQVGKNPLGPNFLALPPKLGSRDQERARGLRGRDNERICLVARAHSLIDKGDRPTASIRLSGVPEIEAFQLWVNLSQSKLDSLRRSFPMEIAALTASERRGAVVALIVGELRVGKKAGKEDRVTLSVVDAALMWVTGNLIPISSGYEFEVAARLDTEQRSYVKPLRYDADESDVFPDFELLDTGTTSPYPMEVYGLTSESYELRKQEKQEFYSAHYPGRHWFWNAAAKVPIPAFPPAAE